MPTQVFAGGTALSEVYSQLAAAAATTSTTAGQADCSAADGGPGSDGHGTGGVAPGVDRLLHAASTMAGTRVRLPEVSHAPGFTKYTGLAAGEAAHEAGYDAFMTGAVFARLLPLIAGRIALDEPGCVIAAAARDAVKRAATRGARPLDATANTTTTATDGEETTADTDTDADADVAAVPGIAVADGLVPGLLLKSVRALRGRLNLTYSDIPYAALNSADPVPDRPCVFHVSGLAPGYRGDDVARTLSRIGLVGVRRRLLCSINQCVIALRDNLTCGPIMIPQY
jgi:hypothetical protein